MIVVAVVLTVVTAGIASAVAYSAAYATAAAGASFGTAYAVGMAAGFAASGAIVGAATGALSAALHGGDLGDILRGAVVGGIQGALAGSLHMVGGTAALNAANIVGHGIVGGLANVAMGGKFGDGFLSAAASAATAVSGLTSPKTAVGKSLGFAGRTAVAAAAGGTIASIGGGKFANGAVTGAFHHLVNAEAGKLTEELLLKFQTVLRLRIDMQVSELKMGTLDHPIEISDAELEVAQEIDYRETSRPKYLVNGPVKFYKMMSEADGFFFWWARRGNPYIKIPIGNGKFGIYQATDLNYQFLGMVAARRNMHIEDLNFLISGHNVGQALRQRNDNNLHQIARAISNARRGYDYAGGSN